MDRSAMGSNLKLILYSKKVEKSLGQSCSVSGPELLQKNIAEISNDGFKQHSLKELNDYEGKIILDTCINKSIKPDLTINWLPPKLTNVLKIGCQLSIKYQQLKSGMIFYFRKLNQIVVLTILNQASVV